MLHFAVRFPSGAAAGSYNPEKELFHFGTEGDRVLFAGSRRLDLDPLVTGGLVTQLGTLGAHFLTGCADGVDASFRYALADSAFVGTSLAACAFNSKVKNMEIPAKKVVSDDLPPRVALAKRTVWLCREADLLILFPSDPIGPGSALAFKTMTTSRKPVFVVQESEPEQSSKYDVYPSNLFGLAQGFWCVPKAPPQPEELPFTIN